MINQTKKQKIDIVKFNRASQILTRAVKRILPSKTGLADIMQKRKIRLYLGIDPTSPMLHLGHTIPLRKLKQFQELGHEAILLFGTFTARVGDPSGRDKKRVPLTEAQIKQNMATYKKQAAKVLDVSKLKFKGNAEWLAKLTFADVLELSSHITVSRLLERDMFQRRLEKGEEIWPNELLYPLMQGYDSVAMDVDLEIGASDQLFNMLVGRKLQKDYNKKEKFVLTTPLLLGLDGRKMSKTYGNTVNLEDKPDEMFGKIMSMKDELILDYFELCTDTPLTDIKKMEKGLKAGKINPRDIKAKLAKEIVTMYHSKKAAQKAEHEFERVFKKKKMPTGIAEVEIKQKKLNILDLLVKTKLAGSRSQAKRLILQKAIKINGCVQENWQKVLKVKSGLVVQKGKRRFIRIS